MEDEYKVLTLIQSLKAAISDAPHPFLHAEQCIVDQEEILTILNEIEDVFPRDLRAAQNLLDKRSGFLGNARQEAEQIRQRAEQEHSELVSKNEITSSALKNAKIIESEAQERAQKRENEANEYYRKRVAEAENLAHKINAYTVEYTEGQLQTLRELIVNSGKGINDVLTAALSDVKETESKFRSASRATFGTKSDKGGLLPLDEEEA